MPQTRKNFYTYSSLALGILAVQIAFLAYEGHVWTCTCGYITAWSGDVLSFENSQQLTDWYTFSHIIHGFIFFFLLSLIFPKSSPWYRLMLAVGVESMWEMFENSSFIINRYRTTSLGLNYYGDSILNSVSDTCAMAFGFVLARKLPVWSVILLALLFESVTAYIIHDNLTLNIVNLIHPFHFIQVWQAALY